ncbi:MAG TPA: hypothetical protein VJB82_04480 [Candidatus Peribacterales bacterium]|nr:hypothetical protein [Candidatus Peribacterales bacterium]
MNHTTHLHHSEDSFYREHRLAFAEGEAPNANNAPNAGVPENREAGGEAPADDPEKAGGERVEEADAGSKKAKASVDDMAEKLSAKTNEGADKLTTKEDVMEKMRTDLLSVLTTQLAGRKLGRSADVIRDQVMKTLEQKMNGVPFDEKNPQEYLAKVHTEAEAILRSHPDVVRETTAADAEKGVDSPLTPKELEEAKNQLGSDILKEMKEFLAKGNSEMQQSLTKLWLGAQGFSVDNSVKELKQENLTLANTHRMNTIGRLINVAVLGFTSLKLLKGTGDRIGKSIDEGVAKVIGKTGKPTEGPKVESKEVMEAKITKFNAAQGNHTISLHSDGLHIKSATPRDGEFLERVLDEHQELDFKGKVAEGGYILAPDKLDKLIALISGNGKKKEQWAQNNNMQLQEDGTYKKAGRDGTFSVMKNMTLYWDGAPGGNLIHYADGRPPKIDTAVSMPDFNDPVKVTEYLTKQKDRAENVPATKRQEIVTEMENVANFMNRSAKQLREQIPVTPEAGKEVKMIKAQTWELQEETVRNTIAEIKKIT